ncbi:TOMM precursor leader peptide-binding protein [Paenibacillus tarimensis]
MKPSVWLVGSGVFADWAADTLECDYNVVRFRNAKALQETGLPGGTEIRPVAAVSAHDYRAVREELEIQRLLRQEAVPYLRSHLYGDRSFIGPWVMPNDTGCVQCAEIRIKTAHPSRSMLDDAAEARESERYLAADKLWTVPFLDMAAALVHEDVGRIATGGKPMFLHAMYFGQDGTMVGRTHAFLPVSNCAHCGKLPDDSEELANQPFVSRIKPHPRVYRLDNSKLTREKLRELYYDWRMGLVNHVFRDKYAKFVPMAGSELPLYGADGKENGFGRTLTYEESEMTAVLESLERYAGMQPRGRRTVMRGAYQEFRERAIDPRLFGLHAPEQASLPGFRYAAYDDRLPIGWVWARSCRRQAAVLVPEQVVYYRLPDLPGKPVNRFVYETSNGCAMGGSWEEAAFHALLEVVERDAFLVAWYNRLPLVELSLDDAEDVTILLIRDRLEAAGYRLHLFDMTMDSGIPSVWATIVNPAEDAKVKTYTAAGAHPNPEKAIMGALVEVATSISIYEELLPQKRGKAEAILKDDSLVQTMEDHVLLYSHPGVLERFDFLWSEGRNRSGIKEMYAGWYAAEPPADLTVELEQLIYRLLETNHDVLLVDETTPELEQLGLKAVKALVPGMLTMSFGHQYRRIVPERVFQTPVRTGRRTEPITADEMNAYAHPFP